MLGSNKKTLYTLAVTVVGIALFLILILGRDRPEKRPPTLPPAQLVDVVVAHPTHHRLMVRTQGNVQPRREIDLVAQVTGKIIAASPHFADGSFFNRGELLVRIEQDDYRVAEQQAMANVANAEQLLAEERGRARQAKREWRDLGNEEANKLFLRRPQLATAETALISAKASLKKAHLDLERTQINAPFDGRIRETLVDIGQYVTTGTRIARIYSTDIAEIRLPLTDRQAAMLELPEHYRQAANKVQSTKPGLPVRLESRFGGKSGVWQAYITRTDASIDVESRQLFAVAEVRQPFARNDNDPQRPTLNMGQFVDAYIDGKEVSDVLILPRSALRPRNRIWTVDGNSRLHIVDVEVLQTNQDHVVVKNGFAGPQKVITSNMSLVVEGLAVTLKDNNNEQTVDISQPNATEAIQ